MDKKGKIISIVAASVLAVGATVGGLLLARKKPQGTQAAQILLARENLDSNDTKISWNDILTNQTLNGGEKSGAVNSSVINISQGSGELVHDSKAGKVYFDGSNYTFTNLSGASNDGVVIESRIFGIEYRAQKASELISYIKNDLNIINKWVKLAGGTYLLSVDNGSETLIEKHNMEDGSESFSVLERKTLENTKSVYRMLQSSVVDGKLNFPSFTCYTPNEKYEYYYEHGGDIKDFVIAENKKDYWNIMMLDDDSFSNVIVKDDFAYTNSTSFSNLDEEIYGGRVISSSLKNDIVYIYNGGATLFLDNFNNIASLSVDKEFVSGSTFYNGDVKENYYDASYTNNIDINLSNGKTLSGNQTFSYENGSVTLGRRNIMFFSNPGFADPQYSASLELTMPEDITIDKQFALLKEFLTDNGITCKYNLDDIKKSITTNSEYHAALPDYYTWNGYEMTSSENVELGTKVLHSNFDDFYKKYTDVKNNEIVSPITLAKLSKNADFNDIKSFSLESATYLDGKITINNASAIIEKANLLEKEKDYKLVIGLSKTDSNGNPISKNTVELKSSSNAQSRRYSNEDLTLLASSEYTFPLVLEEGNYVVVCYAATKEGIRVSKLQPIAFLDSVNDTLENAYMNFEVKTLESKILMVTATTKLSFETTLPSKESYSYSQVKRALIAVVLSCGYAKEGEQIVDSNNNICDNSTTFESGRYKLEFTVPTQEGPCDAYVYINLD